MASPILSLKKLGLAYEDHHVLHDISLDIHAGERIAIVGLNGAGKSSLFDVMSGTALNADAARIVGGLYLNGQSIEHLPVYQRVHLGLIRGFQHSRLFSSLSVADHLRLSAWGSTWGQRVQIWQRYAFWRTMKNSTEEERALLSIANSLGLNGNDAIIGLNYGAQRLLEVGMLISAKAQVILLDEVCSGLSPSEIEKLLDVLQEKSQEQTILFIEHDMNVVQRLADRIVVLKFGALAGVGTWRELVESGLLCEHGVL